MSIGGMTLRALEAQLLRVVEPGHYAHVDELQLAHGIRFTCPQCGDHQVLVWFRDRAVPETEEPTPRWSVSGTGIEDLTLAPSINVRGCWHGFVRGGEVR